MAVKPFAPYAAIQAVIDEAEEKIGFQRAVIGLQSILHQYRRLRYIDGFVREEIHRSLEAAVAAVGEDKIADVLSAKLKARFPNEFAAPAESESYESALAPVESEALAPVESEARPVKARRVR